MKHLSVEDLVERIDARHVWEEHFCRVVDDTCHSDRALSMLLWKMQGGGEPPARKPLRPGRHEELIYCTDHPHAFAVLQSSCRVEG